MAVAGIASLHAWVIRAYDTVSLTNFFAPTKNFSWREKFFSAARWRLTAAGKIIFCCKMTTATTMKTTTMTTMMMTTTSTTANGDDVGNDNGDDDDNNTNSNDNDIVNNDDYNASETKQNDKNFTSRQKYFPRKSCFTPFL